MTLHARDACLGLARGDLLFLRVSLCPFLSYLSCLSIDRVSGAGDGLGNNESTTYVSLVEADGDAGPLLDFLDHDCGPGCVDSLCRYRPGEGKDQGKEVLRRRLVLAGEKFGGPASVGDTRLRAQCISVAYVSSGGICAKKRASHYGPLCKPSIVAPSPSAIRQDTLL